MSKYLVYWSNGIYVNAKTQLSRKSRVKILSILEIVREYLSCINVIYHKEKVLEKNIG